MTATSTQKCAGCYACFAVCPRQCIQMKPDRDGFEYPEIDRTLCTDCHLCEKVCRLSPILKDAVNTMAYAAKAKSNSIRLESSSGGVFTLLAEWILQQGGAVYGVALNKDAAAQHIRVADRDELYRLRGSKYVQSRIGSVYKSVEEDLSQGLWVLFSGTPCQIGGLRNYLGEQSHDSLLCQDLICHGVPPQKAWKKYLHEKGFDGNAEVSFRDKSISWASFSMRIKQGNRSYKKLFAKDAYGRAFLSNVMLRPSCYSCRYKGMNYRSDITLADFWGIQDVLPDFMDDLGVSLLLIHTKLGQKVFEEIEPELESRNISVEDAVRGNMSSITGVTAHPNRARFFNRIDNRSFEWLVSKYVKGSLITRTIRYIKRRI